MAVWTDEDVETLKSLYCHTSLTSREIADKMGRSVGSVRMKITKDNLVTMRTGLRA